MARDPHSQPASIRATESMISAELGASAQKMEFGPLRALSPGSARALEERKWQKSLFFEKLPGGAQNKEISSVVEQKLGAGLGGLVRWWVWPCVCV